MSKRPKAYLASFRGEVGRLFRWLAPGLGVKRWFFILLGGITFIAVGVALFVLDIYRNTPNTWWLPIITTIALQDLPRWVRVAIFGTVGVGLTVLGIWGINRSLLIPFLRPGVQLVDQVADYRRRERGPRVVVIGGGHGIATVLRGMKEHTQNLTAVVSVADDGGSSGELRRNLGILPPGDIRNCLAALSDDEALLTQLFQYRFGEDTGLGGHSFGNLFISALADVTGNFEEAVAESGRALSVNGQVLPATLHNVRLVADIQLPQIQNEVRVEGESQIPRAAGRVRRVWLEPDDAPAYPPVIQAILSADMIVIGPGSLYTSILPNVLVRDLMNGIRASRAFKVFVTNIVTEPGETESFTCRDHICALEELIGENVIDIIICNSCYDGELMPAMRWVQAETDYEDASRLYATDLVDREKPGHHDAKKLAHVLMDLYNERTGPLVRESTTQTR
jgi:uncharacterized cofD-like protein